jgi:MSHA pilin protein MshC
MRMRNNSISKVTIPRLVFLQRCRGFTVVEIIITILIISILAVSVYSRLSDNNTFEGLIVRDQIISLARIAQQNALGRQDVELRVTPTGSGDVTIETRTGTTTLQSVTTSISSLTLESDVNNTASCSGGASNTLSSSDYLRLRFAELGDLEDSGVVNAGYPSAVSSAVRICINDDPILSVCVSPGGFAYAGDCDA